MLSPDRKSFVWQVFGDGSSVSTLTEHQGLIWMGVEHDYYYEGWFGSFIYNISYD